MFKRKKIHTLISLAMLAGGPLALAGESAVLEEVYVTAQKRAERLLDVPISVSAIGGSQLERRGIEGLSNLNAVAPNVIFRESPGTSMISVVSIRGSVTGTPAIWMDPPVGIYVDGVYVSKSQGSVFDVIDVERIEVLRGPQGTLFGRNTEGGAINFISRKPAGSFSGSAGFEIGNYGHTLERVAMDLPKMGILSLNFGYRKQERDPWVKNTTPGVEGYGKIDKEAYRFAANLDISPNLQVDYKFDHSEANNTPRPTTAYRIPGWAGSLSFFNAFLPYLTTERPSAIGTNAGYPLFERSKVDGHALTVDYQLNANNSLKYIYSTRKMQYADGVDLDGTSAAFNLYYQRRTQLTSNSHELQWTGHGERLNYVAGLYAFDDDGYTVGPQAIFGFKRTDYGTKTKANAWYGQLDYKLTDAWTVTAGLRHTTEEKSGSSLQFPTIGFDGPAASAPTLNVAGYKASWSANTPVFALGYKLNETTQLYGRVAKGFKSGGFSGELSDPVAIYRPYNPEKSLSMEVGIKSSFLDNRAQLSAALFQNKITDLHTTQLLPGTATNFVTNAGKATYQGIELEGAFQVADGWKLQGSYGYLDAKFDEFIDNALNIPGRPLIDTASNRVPLYAPKHTLSLNVDGRLARTAWGTLRMVMDYTYTSEQYLSAANKSLSAANAGGQYLAAISRLPSEAKINARVMLTEMPIGGPGQGEIALWVKNLTDVKHPLPNIDLGYFVSGSWPEPRMYGMSFNYKW